MKFYMVVKYAVTIVSNEKTQQKSVRGPLFSKSIPLAPLFLLTYRQTLLGPPHLPYATGTTIEESFIKQIILSNLPLYN